MEHFRQCKSQTNFNSRPCERGDPTNIHEYHDFMLFQFTPLREGRLPLKVAKYHDYLFQFTPLREGRPGAFTWNRTEKPFQFTPLREGRPYTPPNRGGVINFNSRPCERGDRWMASKQSAANISIHAPARGATYHMILYGWEPTISIHAPARGATWADYRYRTSLVFQFTPLREGRLRMSTPLYPVMDISIHAPARGATSSLTSTWI